MADLTTESSSLHDELEKKSIREILTGINEEDARVAAAVKAAIPQIEKLAHTTLASLQAGGRLFYIGAGTSGRLGIVDASECPPTFGLAHGRVIGIIAGGDHAIRKAVEFAEDSPTQAWEDLKAYAISNRDIVVGIAASGKTPYVVGGLKIAQANGIPTGCITCNTDTPVAQFSDFPVEVVVGPEYVTGSTRMKAGTAQKMVLNMLSTSVMIKLGRIRGNKMVDMQLSNTKLVERAIRMVCEALQIDKSIARKLLNKHGSVRKAIDAYQGD